MDIDGKPRWSGWWVLVVVFGVLLIVELSYGFIDGWTTRRILRAIGPAIWVGLGLFMVRQGRRRRRSDDHRGEGR